MGILDAAPTVGAFGKLVSGNAYFVSGAAQNNTGAPAGGSLRAFPFYMPNACTLSRIGLEITTIGDVGSKVRLGIYSDTGNATPGNLLLDAGQIAGDSATVQGITISQAIPRGLHWFCAVNQSVTTTAPTWRAVNTPSPIPLVFGTSDPTAGLTIWGFQASGVAGALPASFGSPTASATMPRIFVKVA